MDHHGTDGGIFLGVHHHRGGEEASAGLQTAISGAATIANGVHEWCSVSGFDHVQGLQDGGEVGGEDNRYRCLGSTCWFFTASI